MFGTVVDHEVGEARAARCFERQRWIQLRNGHECSREGGTATERASMEAVPSEPGHYDTGFHLLVRQLRDHSGLVPIASIDFARAGNLPARSNLMSWNPTSASSFPNVSIDQNLM